MKPEEIIA